MPIPKPRTDENKQEFLERFMQNSLMIQEYPNETQRYAIAIQTWNNLHRKEVAELKTINKQIGIIQKAEILDEEKRIIRVKASDNNFDRDSDRISINNWRMPGYNPPLVDSHKTSDTMDRRLGEIINAFSKDGYYWNDIQLDTPQGEATEWTNGEKLANRLWKLAKEGKDLRFSVGFIPDENKMSRNERGGIDFAGQEQTELSFVLMPSNARAGNKEMEVDKKVLVLENSLENLLLKKVKELLNKENRVSINVIYVNEVVFNSWGYEVEDDDSTWYDKYYRIGYGISGEEVTLIGTITEVKPWSIFIDKNKDKYDTKNIDNILKEMIIEQAKKIQTTAIVTKGQVENEVEETEKIDVKKMIAEAVNKKIKSQEVK